MRRKQQSSNVSEVLPLTLPPSYFKLVMEDIDGFLEISEAHASGLRDFLGLKEEEHTM
jgi:hypothetical protein